MNSQSKITRYWILCLLCSITVLKGMSASIFPVKKDGKWGFIDASGQLVISAQYDALSKSKHFGYFQVQIGKQQGLIDQQARKVLPIAFDRVMILDSLLFGVESAQGWTLINHRMEVLRTQYFEEIKAFKPGFFLVKDQEGWGVLDPKGVLVCPTQYEKIEMLGPSFFLVTSAGRQGIYEAYHGERIATDFHEIILLEDRLFLTRQEGAWSIYGLSGEKMVSKRYQDFERISKNFLRLFNYNQSELFSIPCGRIIAKEDLQTFYPLTNQYLLSQSARKMGVIDICGNVVLPPQYQEVLWFSEDLFRVKINERWILVKKGGEVLETASYEYIAPPQGQLALVLKNNRFGLINRRGVSVLPPEYQKIELNGSFAKAYPERPDGIGEKSVEVFKFDEGGLPLGDTQLNKHFKVKIGSGGSKQLNPDQNKASYILSYFEWFYDSQVDRWGLRDIQNGHVKIAPSFAEIKVQTDLGITLVGLPSSGNLELERTTFRMNTLYGIVQNETGLLLGNMQFRHLFMEDFRAGNTFARCILKDGQYALVNLRGQIQQQTYSYLGPFVNGVARAGFSGKLSASIAPEFPLAPLREYLTTWESSFAMLDDTQYDKLLLSKGSLFCEDCSWTYIDAAGQKIGKDYFLFASDMVNGVAMVFKEGKWGLMGENGRLVLPCSYDDIQFLENTDSTIVQLYIRKTRYGLIDTLGKLTINAIYDEIGPVRESRLAVQENTYWGFADANGILKVKCNYEAVQAFQEGLAAIKQNGYWGFIDRAGNLKITPQYLATGNFSNGLCWVKTKTGYGYINPKGDFQIAPKFNAAQDFHEGVGVVRTAKGYGLINEQGDFILEPQFAEIQAFSESGVAVGKLPNEQKPYVLLNPQGQTLGTQSFEWIGAFSEGLAPVKHKGKYGFLDANGKLLIKPTFSGVQAFSEGRAMVKNDQLCTYIKKDGVIIRDFEFTDCQDFQDGRAVVYKGLRKAGLLDKEGGIILEPKINELLEFSEGRGLVKDDTYRFYFITEESSDYQNIYDQASAFQNGVAVVQVNQKWGIINQNGVTLVRPKYSNIEAFNNGYAKVEIAGVTGLSTLDGELIMQPDYEHISYAGGGLFRVEQGDKVGYCKQDGAWVWALGN